MQVDDDLELLELMVADFKHSSNGFEATARWAEYSAAFLDFLRTEGLKNFRSRRHARGEPGHVLASFGAVDLNPSLDAHKPEDMYHAAASNFVGSSAVPIKNLPASKVGMPEGFEIGGQFYTLSWLNFYCRYAFVSKFIDFKDQIIVEIGSGSGKQAEMLKKAHPELTILIFDLPTQLYVANQYLAKVFFGTDYLADYRLCRGVESFSDIKRGKINVFPHWKYPIIDGQKIDLLWNAASFQEMGVETAARYISGAHQAENLYLMYNIKYREGAQYPGSRGVIDPKYIPLHVETDRSLARLAYTPAQWIYFDSIWKRRRE